MLYDTIVCVVDSAGNKLTLDRVTEFVRLTGNVVHVIYLAPEHLIAGEVMPTPGLPDAGTDVEIDTEHVRQLQEYLARANAEVRPTARSSRRPTTGAVKPSWSGPKLSMRTWSSSTPRLAGRRPRPSSPRRSRPATTRWRCSSHVRPPEQPDLE